MLARTLRFYARLYVSRPGFIPGAARQGDLDPAWIGWLLTSLVSAGSTLIARARGLPLGVPPWLPVPDYRLWQAAALPVVLAAGALLGTGAGWLLARGFRRRPSFRTLAAVCVPALWAGMWPILMPADLAVSLGWLAADAPGWEGFWIRELVPALAFGYMLWLQARVYREILGLLRREAFVLGFVGLLACWGWWALWLR